MKNLTSKERNKIAIIDELYDLRVKLQKSQAELYHVLYSQGEFLPEQARVDLSNAITAIDDKIKWIKNRSEIIESQK